MDDFHFKLVFFTILIIGSIKGYPLFIKKANEPGGEETSLRSKILAVIGIAISLIGFFGLTTAGYIFVEGLQSIDKDPSNLYNRYALGDILVWTSIYIFTFISVVWINAKKSELIVKAYNRAISRVASEFISQQAGAHPIGEDKIKLMEDFFGKYILDETAVYTNIRELSDDNFIKKNLESTTSQRTSN